MSEEIDKKVRVIQAFEWKLPTFGFALLTMLSFAPALTGAPSIAVPVPIYLLVLYWTVGHGAIIVIPLLFLLNDYVLRRLRLPLRYTTWFFVALAVLNAWYFTTGIGYGLKYQGALHTWATVIENVLVLSLMFGLLASSKVKRRFYALRLLNLLAFAGLAWCLFPTLGELP